MSFKSLYRSSLVLAILFVASFAAAQGPAFPYYVTLTWTAPTPAPAGYFVYRALFSGSPATCGTFAKLNTTAVTVTNYTDSTVANDTAYCYAATAVNSSGTESGFSNTSNAVIPPAPPTNFKSTVG